MNKSRLTFILLILFSFSLSTLQLYSQGQLTSEQERKLKEEEANETNLQVTDSTQFVMDTVGLTLPLKNHSRLILNDFTPYKFITKKDILFKSFYTFYEIFKSERIGYPLSLGFPGMNNSIGLAGAFLGGTNLRLGGTNLNDFETGIANLSLVAVESFESAEIFLGSDAVVLGNNSTGSLINIQEVNHNTSNPYTKLWYSQGSSDLIAADGTFSHNFTKNYNLDLGFRSLNSPGRFTNQSLNSWNLRAKVRWNPTFLTTISLSENFSNYGIGENGGNSITESNNIYNEIESTPVLANSDSRLFRHHLNLNISTYLDSTKYFGITSASAFISSVKEFKDGDYIFSKPSDSIDYMKYSDYVLSNRTQIETNFGAIGAIIGEEISFNKLFTNSYFGSQSYLNFALYGLMKMKLFETIELSGGGRYFNQFGNNGISIGAKLKIKIDSNRFFFGDISKSDRMPSLFEGKNLNPEHHYLILAGLDWKIGGMNLELLGFARQVDLPILFHYAYDTTSQSYLTKFDNSSNMRIFGFETNINFKLKEKVFINSFVKMYFSQLNSENKNILPKLYSGIKSYYKVNAGVSELHLGLEYELLIGGGGMGYFPGYTANYFVDNNNSFMGNGINLFVEGKLGDAYLKASLNNILGQGYYFTPYYPEFGTHFNFTFSWAFLN